MFPRVHNKDEDNSQLFLEFLEYLKRCKVVEAVDGDPLTFPYYRLRVDIVERYFDEYNANLHRMTNEARMEHYKRNPRTFHTHCPDGKEHKNIQDPSEPSYMCDTAYICVNCGWTHRVDSSD